MTSELLSARPDQLPPGTVGVAAALPPPERLLPSNVRVVNSDAELRDALVQAGDDTVVVDFGAAWCEKCKAVEPVVASLGEQYSHLRFVFADADFLPELASDVRYTPTFAVYQRGKKVDEFVGTNQQRLRDRAWLWS